MYCAIDPATAILEVAVHKGFKALDTVPHVLTAINVDATQVLVVQPETIPNANWLRPGIPSAGQQAFGDTLLPKHKFVVIPSVVSTRSWNLVFVASNAVGAYEIRSQEAVCSRHSAASTSDAVRSYGRHRIRLTGRPDTGLTSSPV